MGFTQVPTSVLNQQPQGTADLENQVSPAQRLQQLQQQAQGQPPDQQSQQPPDDPIRAQLTAQIQNIPQKLTVKQMLGNFFSGMSHGLLPVTQSPDFQRKQALANLDTYDSTQANVGYKDALTRLSSMSPYQMPDGSTIQVANKDIPRLEETKMKNALMEKMGLTTITPAHAQANPKLAPFVGQVMNKAVMDSMTKLQISETKPETHSAASRDDRFIKLMGVDPSTWTQDDREFVKGYKEQVDVTKTQPGVARFVAGAKARAEMTPFETVVPGTNEPRTISNLQALQTGAPKVSLATEAKLGGQYAQFNDAYGILDNIDQLAGQVNLGDNAARARITAGYAALKDPQVTGLVARLAGPIASEFLSNYLGRQPIASSLKPEERALVLAMAQGKAAATGLRGILGQAGTNEMQQRLDAGLFPGGQMVGDIDALRQQTKATRGLLDRFVVGQPQVGLNAPGSSTALENKTATGATSLTPPHAPDSGMKWQHRMTNGKVEWRQIPSGR